MNVSRRILVVHADARARRRLVLLLVESGYDVRACGTPESALAAAHGEWFDLALVDFALPGGEGFEFTRLLRQTQPTVPIIMLLPALELPLIIEGIRLGLTDVLPAEQDPRPLLQRVNSLLRPGANGPTVGELSPGELAEVEAALARLEAEPASRDPADIAPDLRGELFRATRERADLEGRLERALQERAALAAELQGLLSQQADAARLQSELAQLHAERQRSAAAEATVEQKAQALAEMHVAIAAERQALEEARRAKAAQQAPSDAGAVLEREHLEAIREDLREQESRLREEENRLRQEANQLAQERRRWHEELDQLKEQEENLRQYEQRLREMQSQLEAERIQRVAPPPLLNVSAIVQHDQKLRSEWEKLHRAKELMEAERNVFRDERMALRDLEKTIREREQRLRDLEAQVAAHEVLRRHQPPVSPGGEPASPGVLKTLARAPFNLWGKSGS